MRASLLLSGVFAFQASAFPSALLKGDISAEELAQLTALADDIAAQTKIQNEKRQLGFDLIDPQAIGWDASQKIENSGSHAYKTPGRNDLRGPCPGLNALANHGYIARSGLTNAVEVTKAVNQVYGMGLDLGGFLSVYGAIMAGDVTSFSIGGPPPSGLVGGLTNSLGLIGKPQGLSKAHNRFEGDASPCRNDLYSTGDPVSLDVKLFKELTDLPRGPNGIDLTVMNVHRGARHNYSVATNGYYFAGPFMHYAINIAPYVFIYRFFANHTQEHPDGFLDLETLMSFNGVTRNSRGEFEWQSGRERIPDNWYKRAVGDDFGIASFAKDAVRSLLEHPYLGIAGGNTGEPNTFTGLDLGNLTGGVYNAATLLQGNNAMCLAYQQLSGAAPDIARGLLGNVLLAVQKLSGVLDPIIQSLGCPPLTKFDNTAFYKFPGSAGL